MRKAAPKQPLTPPKPPAKAEPLVSASPGPVSSSSGGSSPAFLIIAFGAVLAMLAVGISFMPASAMPVLVGMRLERSRQTIVLVGLAIGVACLLVGLLTALAGR